MKSNSRFFSCSLAFLGFAMILFVVAVAYDGSDPCNPIDTWQNMRAFERYADHLLAVEEAAKEGGRPPSSLLAQMNGDMQLLSSTEYNACVEPVSRSLHCALFYGASYYGEKDVKARNGYEQCLRDYYRGIETLRACWPLCKGG